MRITTANAYASTIANMQQQQQALNTSQQQLSSGLRVSVPSDDPIAAAQSERALATMVATAANQSALATSQNMTTQVESALGNATDLMQSARQLVAQAGDGSYSDSDRQAIATQLTQIRGQLLQLANGTDGQGNYLFGGQGSATPPFTDPANGVVTNPPTAIVYNGSSGQGSIMGSQTLPMAPDGQQVWLSAANPTAGGAPLSVFGVLDTAIDALNTTGQSATQIAQTVSTGLAGIDAVSANLSTARTAAGASLQTMTTLSTQLQQTTLAAQTTQSNAVDLDMVKGISTFQNLQTGYQAALQSYASLQKISLFNYISA